jgi:tetratricopeptide (TPR) repeat protein
LSFTRLAIAIYDNFTKKNKALFERYNECFNGVIVKYLRGIRLLVDFVNLLNLQNKKTLYLLILIKNKKLETMNKIVALTLLLTGSFLTFGQVQVPQLSPEAEIEQTVGLTEIEVEYSRPSRRDRTIFGELLPYDKMWRTGANKNTTISFSTSAEINGKKVEEGVYAIFIKPIQDAWMIYLYADTDNWGVPEQWDEDKVVGSYKVKVEKTHSVIETFTIQFENITTTSTDLVFSWEKTKVVLPIAVPTEELTEVSIKETMKGDSISERDYYGAASYYLTAQKNLKEALSFIDKAIEIRGEEAFWYIRKKALIEYQLGMKKQAIKSAKRSLESAGKAGNDNYVKMNEESIKSWESE